jgi:pectate disaccharide-lyase
MLTICDTVAKAGACYKICPSSYSCPATGATIWVKAGNYRLTRRIDIGATRPGAGPGAGVMKLFAVPGARPVLDATNTEGAIALHIKGSYWHVKGLEIKNAPSNCVKVEGGYVTVEDTVVHNCGNTGITISRYAGEDMSVSPGSNNLILNCDSYDNVGPGGDGEDADGFGAKESSGTGNIFRGCRAWNNADDGYDFYGWANPITIEDSWAFESNKMGASGGDGNGFKLGPGPGRHVLRNAIAAYNTKRGYTCNGADGQSTCTNCRGCSNTEGLNDTGSRAVAGSVTNMSPCVDLARAKAARTSTGGLPSI